MPDLKDAFGQIHAGEELKRDTLLFLRDSIRQPEPQRNRTVWKRVAAACVCLLILVFGGVYAHNLYFTETLYMDMDINPSVELAVNRFDNVIGVYAYNEDGERLLSSLQLLHKPYRTAAAMLTEAAAQQGYLTEGGLVSVTLQADGQQDSLQTGELKTDIMAAVKAYLTSVDADVAIVDSDTRQHAHEENISPAKYLAILELLQADPTATMDGCKGHSIGEIRALTEEHESGHHEPDSGGLEPAEPEAGEPEEPAGAENSGTPAGPEAHGGSHHEEGHD